MTSRPSSNRVTRSPAASPTDAAGGDGVWKLGHRRCGAESRRDMRYAEEGTARSRIILVNFGRCPARAERPACRMTRPSALPSAAAAPWARRDDDRRAARRFAGARPRAARDGRLERSPCERRPGSRSEGRRQCRRRGGGDRLRARRDASRGRQPRGRRLHGHPLATGANHHRLSREGARTRHARHVPGRARERRDEPQPFTGPLACGVRDRSPARARANANTDG